DLLLVLRREDHHADRGQLTPDALGRLDAAEARQVDLDDENVRLELVRLRHRLLAVRGNSDDVHVRFFFDDLPDPHRRDAARVGEQDADRTLRAFAHECSSRARSSRRARSGSTFFCAGSSNVTAVPFPGVDWIWSVPPMSSARSRMESRPTDFL